MVAVRTVHSSQGMRSGGETGIHAALRTLWSRGRAGSSPAPSTSLPLNDFQDRESYTFTDRGFVVQQIR